MRLKSLVVVVSLVMLMISFSWAELQFNFNKAPIGSVTIDGSLNEAIWQGKREKIDVADLAGGTSGGDADNYIEWKAFWDDEGLNLGVWFFDDAHNATRCLLLTDAQNGYEDDGLQILIGKDWNDTYNNFAQANDYGGSLWSLVKGFGNDDPAAQYGGMWSSKDGNWYTEYWTIDKEHNNGIYGTYATTNGTTYEYEVQYRWNAPIFRNLGTPSEQWQIAFGLIVNDNDGGTRAQSQFRQGHGAGQQATVVNSYNHSSKQPIHKGILIGPSSINPAASLVKSGMNRQGFAGTSFDIFGKTFVKSQAVNVNTVLFQAAPQGKGVRNLIFTR